MSEEVNKDNSSKENTSTCPPIEIGKHQNSYNPKNNEKRGSN